MQKEFHTLDTIFLFAKNMIKRFDKNSFCNIKGRTPSSESRKLVVAVMKSILGVIQKMLANGRLVKKAILPLVWERRRLSPLEKRGE